MREQIRMKKFKKHYQFCSGVFDVLLDFTFEIQSLREETNNAIPLKTLAQLRQQVLNRFNKLF